jgi:hypothetical protein
MLTLYSSLTFNTQNTPPPPNLPRNSNTEGHVKFVAMVLSFRLRRSSDKPLLTEPTEVFR